jgi:glycosyltransferase involved in cell wall biosynthesis
MLKSLQSRRRIAHVVSSCEEFSGAIRVALNLANRFCEDYEVHVIYVYGSHDIHSSSLDGRIATKTLIFQKVRQRKAVQLAFLPLKNYLKEQEIEVVFAHGVFSALTTLPVAISMPSKCFVYCDHSALAKREGQKDRADTVIRYLLARFFDAVVTLTEQNRQDYIRIFHIKPSRLFAIYNWISPDLLSRPVCYDQTIRKLLWAGRLAEEKGIDLLIEIASKVLPKRPDWQWEVFGTGEMGEALAMQAEQRGISKQLVLRHYADDMYSLYPHYAVVTLTSYREGLPMVLLEGKASGLPMVAFDVITGPREIIRDDIDGFLVDPYDVDAYANRLEQLMDEPQLRNAMSLRARDDIHRFEKESIYAQWRELIENVVLWQR